MLELDEVVGLQVTSEVGRAVLPSELSAMELAASGADAIEQMLAWGQPNAKQLARINGGVAALPQNAEDLFTWAVEAVSNLTFSYWLWFDELSLKNMQGQAANGRGLSYMRNHAKGADVTGRVYYGALVDGGPRPMQAAQKGAAAHARDVFAPGGNYMRLLQQVFMLRGPGTTEFSPDAYIANVGAGVQASNSIGWSAYSTDTPGSAIVCDISGVDIFRVSLDELKYWPGIEYEVDAPEGGGKKTLVTATAKIVGAKQRELSGVYLGAVPETFTQRPRALFMAGGFGLSAARHLEETYQVARGTIVGDKQTISVPHRVRPGGKPEATATVPPAEKMEATMDLREAVRALVAGDAARLAALEAHGLADDPLAALGALHAEEVAALAKERDDATAALEAQRVDVAKRLGLKDGEKLSEGVERLVREAGYGASYRASLEAEYARQRTRARMPTSAAEAVPLTASWSVEQLVAETQQLRKAANGQVTPGSLARVEDYLETREQGPELPARLPSSGPVKV